ncbi:MAG: hypothetical protein HY288_02510 [Planctomycetia bacterium]|nr:hypothetical protein [Planctomycetia bacterium]
MDSMCPNQASRIGSRHARRWWLVVACALALVGCNAWHPPTYVPPEIAFGPPPLQANPAVVPVMDRDLLWEQVADVVDDYFKIQKEDRVRLVGDLLTEGLLTTYPRNGSTIFEPWNGDSSTPYERLESTLQSIRRTAVVRVIPAEAGFLIEVQVLKELENVPQPETGTVSQTNSAALRNDNSLQRVTNPVGGQQPALGWIGQGRDVALEQLILAQIQGRLGAFGGGPRQF